MALPSHNTPEKHRLSVKMRQDKLSLFEDNENEQVCNIKELQKEIETDFENKSHATTDTAADSLHNMLHGFKEGLPMSFLAKHPAE